jgi:N4-gp56 family major capsid protein
MAIVGETDVNATRQALVSSLVQQALEERAKMLPLVSKYDAPLGAQSVGIPRRDSAAVASALSEDAEVTANAMTLSVDTVALDLYPKRFDVSDVAKMQSSVDVGSLVVEDISSALARTLDKLILDELFNDTLYTVSADHKIPADLTDIKASILDARELLKNQGVQFDGNVHAVVTPAIENLILSQADFVRADAYGAREHIMNGELGMLFGIRFHTHNGITDSNADGQMCIFHKDAVGVGIQQEISLEYFRDVKFLNDVYTGKMFAGAKLLGAGAKSVMFASDET